LTAIKDGAWKLVTSRECSGSVTLYAYGKDHPLYQPVLARKRAAMALSLESQMNAELALQNYTQTKREGLEKMIDHWIRRDEDMLTTLAKMQSFLPEAAKKYSERKSEIEKCARIVRKLYDRGEPIVLQFRQHWDELVELPSRAGADSREFSEDEVNLIVAAAGDALRSAQTTV
jgi:hypothetical protein